MQLTILAGMKQTSSQLLEGIICAGVSCYCEWVYRVVGECLLKFAERYNIISKQGGRGEGDG